MAAITSLASASKYPAATAKFALSHTTWQRVNLPDGASHVVIKGETGGGTVRGYLAFEGSGLGDGDAVTHATDQRIDLDFSAGPRITLSQYARATYILLASHSGTPDVSVLVERESKSYE